MQSSDFKTPGPLMSGVLAAMKNPQAFESNPPPLPPGDSQKAPESPDDFPWTADQLRLIEAISGVMSSGGVVVLCGERGTGKTTIAQEVQRRVGHGIYELAQDYFEDVALLVSGRLFRHVEEAKRIRARRVGTRILILDEMFHVMRDPLGVRVLQDLLIRRHAARRPTILITNGPKEEVEANLDQSIKDRVREGGGLYSPKWKSFRGNGSVRRKSKTL